MKIVFPERCSGPLFTKMRGAPHMLALIITCFLIGALGTYLLGNNFISLAIVVLGFSGILVCAAVTGLLPQGTADWARSAPIKRKAPRIKSEWVYRPKEKTRAFAAIGSAGRERIEFTSPKRFAINDHIWFREDSYIDAEIPSSLETAAHLHSSKICAR
jgi:hypothetical protein